MSKNKNYRRYSEYSKRTEEENPEVVEEEVTEEAVEEVERFEPDLPNVDEDYVKDQGLEVNTLQDEVEYGVIANTEKLNVRNKPEVGNNIIGVYDKGTKVTILKDLGEWYSIELEKNSIQVRGFAMKKFINKI